MATSVPASHHSATRPLQTRKAAASPRIPGPWDVCRSGWDLHYGWHVTLAPLHHHHPVTGCTCQEPSHVTLPLNWYKPSHVLVTAVPLHIPTSSTGPDDLPPTPFYGPRHQPDDNSRAPQLTQHQVLSDSQALVMGLAVDLRGNDEHHD